MDVIVGRAVVCLGVAVMTAAGVNARGVSLVWLTAVGAVVMVLGLAYYWRALPPDRAPEPQPGSPWRFPVASGVAALALALAATPLLVKVLEVQDNVSLAVLCAGTLGQAALVARLDLALGRFGRRPRRRVLLALLTSAVAVTATAVLASWAGGPDLSRWPAFVDAAVVMAVSAGGTLWPRSARPADTDDWDGSGAAWQLVVGDRLERGARDLGGQVRAERLAPPVRR